MSPEALPDTVTVHRAEGAETLTTV
jgi:hypothetical protein